MLPGWTEPIKFKDVSLFCLSCYSSYVARVYELQFKLEKLQAKKADSSSQLSQVFRNIKSKLSAEAIVQMGVSIPESGRPSTPIQPIRTVHEQSDQVSESSDPPSTVTVCSVQLKPPSSSSCETQREDEDSVATGSNRFKYRGFTMSNSR